MTCKFSDKTLKQIIKQCITTITVCQDARDCDTCVKCEKYLQRMLREQVNKLPDGAEEHCPSCDSVMPAVETYGCWICGYNH